jgi:methionyl-tRNA formyltransferase
MTETEGGAGAGKRRLRVALYLGWHRWADWRREAEDDPDAAEEIVVKLAASRHRLCALILRRGDRLAAWSRRLGVPALILPAALCRSVKEARRSFADSGWRKNPRLRRWFRDFEAAGPEVGVVYCGGWLPPPMFSLPPLGFINFHPGPLPELPGYYPEFLLALRGGRRSRGTIHRVSENIDEGEILAYAPVALPPLATSREIGIRMTRAAAAALPACLDRLADGRPRAIRSEKGVVFPATLAAVNREAAIDWSGDSHDMIDRRVRCFCGLPWDRCRPLHAQTPSGPRLVLDVETYAGVFPGLPGEQVGVYRGSGIFAGAPVVRTVEGVAIVGTGGPFRPGRRLRIPAGRLVPSGKRRKLTRLEMIEWPPGGGGPGAGPEHQDGAGMP